MARYVYVYGHAMSAWSQAKQPLGGSSTDHGPVYRRMYVRSAYAHHQFLGSELFFYFGTIVMKCISKKEDGG